MVEPRMDNHIDYSEAVTLIEGQVRTIEQQHGDIPQLALVTLTPQNKQRLFRNACEASKSPIEKTEALMARLERLDPSVARLFGFKSVAISEAPFRLLRTLPKQTKAISWLKKFLGRSESGKDRSFFKSSSSTSDVMFDSFIALSYCWHNQDWTPAPGCQPLEGCPISSMMLDALLQLRQSQDEGVWIDACCIDQNNETEKMHAIGSVDLIYKAARVVIVILEDVYLPNAEADMIRKQQGPSREENLPTIPHAFSRILSSRWFSRAWCSHEFQLAAGGLFLVPTESGLLQLNVGALANLIRCTSPSASIDVPLYGFSMLYQTSASKYSKPYRSLPMHHFTSIIDLNSLHETDKIGIAVNVAGLPLYFRGPKLSYPQCRWALAMLALSAGDLTPLSCTGPKIHLRAELNATSWLRWNSKDSMASYCPPTFATLSHIVSIDPERIILDLLVLEHYTLQPPSSNSILTATTFLDQYCQNINQRSFMNKDIAVHKSPRKRRLQIETLACSLDCGLTWIMESMKFNQDIADYMQFRIKGLGFDLWPLVGGLLIDVYPSEESNISNFTNEQKRSVSQYVFFTLYIWDFSKVESSHMSGMFESSELQCVWLDWGTDFGKALTFIGTGKVSEYNFAVPATLDDPSCVTMDRLWLLKARNSTMDSEWSIVDKIALVTFHPLKEDGTNIIFRAAQTVRG